MATELNKDLTRETTVQVDGKNLLVTMTVAQTIKIRQKGRGKTIQEVEIPIKELFNQLLGGGVIDEDKAMISLTDFRSQYMINANLDLDTKVILEKITTYLLRQF